MLFRRKNRTVRCNTPLLFEILDDNLKDGLCTDIIFTVNGQRHRFGAWGDSGNTFKNVVYYLDKFDYASKAELMENATIEGVRLIDYEEPVTVLECDGCYPESTLKLKALLE